MEIMEDKSKKQITAYCLMLAVLMSFITVFPLCKSGLPGMYDDLQYHLLRIEGVKESLEAGIYPVRIYNFFFDGFGYGSPLFYPDIALLIPALFRIIGLSPVLAYKASIFIFSLCVVFSTFYSLKFILHSYFYAIIGAGMIVLSQFYLADLLNRAGYSEYISFIFLPILFAAIYDFFACEGERIFLFGIAFCGLFLSHMIMTFIAAIFTLTIFVVMSFIKEYREKIVRQIKKIIICMLLSLAAIAYYLFPFLEQILWGDFMYEEPWADVSQYVEPIKVLLFTEKGYFYYIAYVGIGAPIILCIISCIIPIIKSKIAMCRVFFFGGLISFVLMTNIFPWGLLSNTIINMIQFTYRIYPIAIISTVVGMMMFMTHCEYENRKEKYFFGIIIFVLSMVCGICQNTNLSVNETTIELTEGFLEENANFVGRGEWLPIDIDASVINLESDFEVHDSVGRTYDFEKCEMGGYGFETSSNINDVDYYILPLVSYKGYSAVLTAADGQSYELPITSESGLVCVNNPKHIDGVINVEYSGTLIQKISNMISLITFICLIVYWIYSFVIKDRKMLPDRLQ